MALIKEVNGLKPQWGKDCYFSENATIVGEVTMGDECSIWFNAVAATWHRLQSATEQMFRTAHACTRHDIPVRCTSAVT